MRFLDYLSTEFINRQTFLLNYKLYFFNFETIINSFYSIWGRLGKETDSLGQSHVDLLPLVILFIRHSIFGFQHIFSYQSFLCWLNFRPGLEALLISGKFLDDPRNAEIWKNRKKDRESLKAYKKKFEGPGLISEKFPQSKCFREVLSRLNEQFMHPNYEYIDRETEILDQGGSSLFMKTDYFDKKIHGDIHEAHLLAYLNLLDQISLASDELVKSLCGPAQRKQRPERSFAESVRERAIQIAVGNLNGRSIMENFGLWKFDLV